jgi:SAM-dependent methyltransferase
MDGATFGYNAGYANKRKGASVMKIARGFVSAIQRGLSMLTFRSSENYWVERYKKGGNSGFGSYGEFARYKASVLNDFVQARGVQTVIEYGSGDGNQLRLAKYPAYIGFDISQEAVDLCRALFKDDPTKAFYRMDEYQGQTADLTLSLDVLYHLVEYEVFEKYLALLFASAKKYVIIYSTNAEKNSFTAPHVKHRCFTDWVQAHQPGWKLIAHLPGVTDPHVKRVSKADFYLYEQVSPQA